MGLIYAKEIADRLHKIYLREVIGAGNVYASRLVVVRSNNILQN